MFINTTSALRAGYPKPWNIHHETFHGGCLPTSPPRRASEQLIPWKEKGWRRHGFACITKEKNPVEFSKRNGNGEAGTWALAEAVLQGAAGEAASDQHIFWMSCTSTRPVHMHSISASNVLMCYAKSQTPQNAKLGFMGMNSLGPPQMLCQGEKKKKLDSDVERNELL